MNIPMLYRTFFGPSLLRTIVSLEIRLNISFIKICLLDFWNISLSIDNKDTEENMDHVLPYIKLRDYRNISAFQWWRIPFIAQPFMKLYRYKKCYINEIWRLIDIYNLISVYDCGNHSIKVESNLICAVKSSLLQATCFWLVW